MERIAVEAVTFYLVAYTVTTLGAFGVVTVLSDSSRDADRLDDYQGLFWRRPFIAGIFTVMLLSLAGIPATMGFLAKFYVLAAGASATKWSLIIILVIDQHNRSVLLSAHPRRSTPLHPSASHPLQAIVPASGFVLAVLTALRIWFGMYPAPLLDIIQRNAVPSVTGLPTSESARQAGTSAQEECRTPATVTLNFDADVEGAASGHGIQPWYGHVPEPGAGKTWQSIPNPADSFFLHDFHR